MTDLLLVLTESGEVDARLTLTPAGEVLITGEGEAAARSILATYVRRLDASEAEAFSHLHKIGWSNGPLALIPAPN